MRANKNTFPHHTFLRIGKVEFQYSFDTFGNTEGYDRLICNVIRLIGIFGTWYLILKQPRIILLPLMLLFLIMAGFTQVDYFKNKRKKFGFIAWS